MLRMSVIIDQARRNDSQKAGERQNPSVHLGRHVQQLQQGCIQQLVDCGAFESGSSLEEVRPLLKGADTSM